MYLFRLWVFVPQYSTSPPPIELSIHLIIHWDDFYARNTLKFKHFTHLKWNL